MTKKFWADWQERINETRNIWVFYTWNDYKGIERKYVSHRLMYEDQGDRLLRAVFHKDVVELVIEQRRVKLNKGFKSGTHTHIENKYITLHRTEIASIDFFGFK